MDRRFFIRHFGSMAGSAVLVSNTELLHTPSSNVTEHRSPRPELASGPPIPQDAAGRIVVQRHPNRAESWLAPTLNVRPSNRSTVEWDMSAPFKALKDSADRLEVRVVFWTDVPYQGRRQFPPFGSLSFAETLTPETTILTRRFAGFLNGYLKSRGRNLELEYLAFFPDVDQFVVGPNSPPILILVP